MRKLLIILTALFLLPLFSFAQSDSSNVEKEVYPYTFPIWGQKVLDRGIKMPKPAGIGFNYVFNEMYLNISEFKMAIGGVPLESIGVEELGFKKTRAYAHGGNFRADLFILPFLNVYGLFSYSYGGTAVNLQPQIGGVTFPEFSSDVQFNATTFGGGMTLHYAIKKFFISADANISSSKSALLNQNVGVITSSYRFGRRFQFKNGTKLAFYVGAMYRNFINHEGNTGSITLGEALPNIEEKYQNWYDGLSPIQKRLVDEVEQKLEERLGDTPYDKITDLPISYSIKKDLIKKWTFQFGGNYEINDRWMVRGEYGVSDFSKFLMTGVNYRFGF
ncbi:hypothetical protein [Flammeovirga sp. SJP92]|uniref:hypothetical protein n=1 Tax=Flammeovirga sp. SJP92 TaxID=1775430 RepID=UPI0007873A8A|nr:hypothetical protein [Flammeovirga sp. SJP92]KXX67499.1 hypothetical protein AVL50_25875 [Flammeovirga sp. SJP92]